MPDIDNIKELSLYHYVGCPYCAAVKVFIDQIDLDIGQKEILINSVYRNELLQEGGKKQVPCLRIDTLQGETSWLYESQHIIEYLRQINLPTEIIY